MVDILKKTYINKYILLFTITTCLSFYFFYVSNLSLDVWLFTSKYIFIYSNIVFSIFALKRISLIKAVSTHMKIRLKDEGFTLFLIKSIFINILIYFVMTYSIFFYNLFFCKDYMLLFLYFLINLLMQFINECIIMFILYKNKSAALLLLTLFNNFLIQFLILENIVN